MKRLLIECGAAQTRGVLFDGDTPISFFFAPARGDEGEPRPAQSGDVRLGRIRTVNRSLGAAFIDIADGVPAFLNLRSGDDLPTEGSLGVFRVRRSRLGEKGAVLSTEWTSGLSDDERTSVEEAWHAVEAGARDGTPGAILAPRDAATEIYQQAGDVDEVLLTDVAARAALQEFGRPPSAIACGDHNDWRELADDAFESALSPVVHLSSGGRLIFAETQAGAMIDVDAGDASATTGVRLHSGVNKAAASALALELSRRTIGGRIIVDFLKPHGAKERKQLEKIARDAACAIGAQPGVMRNDGLFDCTRARSGPSLLARASIEVSDPAAPGDVSRRWRLSWRAIEAVRALELRLQRAPSAKVRLLVSNAIAAYINARSQWTLRLSDRFGRRFEIVTDPDTDRPEGDAYYDVVETR